MYKDDEKFVIVSDFTFSPNIHIDVEQSGLIFNQ